MLIKRFNRNSKRKTRGSAISLGKTEFTVNHVIQGAKPHNAMPNSLFEFPC